MAGLLFLTSLAAAAFMDLDRLLCLLIILPVIALFFLVLGPLGANGSAAKLGGCGGAESNLCAGLGMSFQIFVSG